MRILLLIITILASFNVAADVASVNFTSPAGAMGRVDGSPLLQSEIAGFNVYTANVDGSNRIKQIIDLSPGATTSLPADALSFTVDVPGGTAITMSTVDTDGREGPDSPAYIVNADPLYPSFTVTITISTR